MLCLIRNSNLFGALRKYLYLLYIKCALLFNKERQAITFLKTILNKYPKDLWIYSQAQKIFRDIEDWDSFFDIYKAVEREDPSSLSIKRNFGSALLAYGRYSEAIPYLQYCITNWSFDSSFSSALANTYGRLGLCYALLGEWASAQTVLQMGEELAPWDLDVIYGNMLYLLGSRRSQEIQKYLDSKIKKYPNFFALYYWKAHYIRFYNCDPNSAIRLYKMALERVNYFKLKKEYIPYYFSVNQYALPEDVLEEFINTLLVCQKIREAQKIISAGVFKFYNKSIDFNALQIRYDINTNHSVLAEKKCARIINTHRKRKKSIYLTLLALAQEKQGKYDVAILNASSSIAMLPGNVEALEALGRLYIATGNLHSAAESFQKALEFNPLDISDLENLGHIFSQIDEPQRAKIYYEKMVTLAPCNSQGWIRLGEIYYVLGDRASAYRAFKRGLSDNNLPENLRQLALKIINSK